MIKPTKTKTGKWTAQVYLYTDENGKKIHPRLTCDTKDELMFKIACLKRDYEDKKGRQTLRDVIQKYIDMSDFLSPTTLAGYNKILKYGFQSIMDNPVDELDNNTMQSAVNLEAKRKTLNKNTVVSPKTVINEYQLISAALRAVCNKSFNVKLPKLQHKNEDLPEPSEVLNIIVGSSIELPCLMAMWMSMSMSEIRGVMCSSIKDGYLSVDRVRTMADSKEVIKEQAKVDSRIRKIRIPDYIMNLIEQTHEWQAYEAFKDDGFLISLTADQLSHRYRRLMKNAGLDISFHDLRHIFASVMLTKLQIPEKIVQTEGGWATDHVMKTVYSQTFSENRQRANDLRDEYFMNAMGGNYVN